jgi:hypothetical protein
VVSTDLLDHDYNAVYLKATLLPPAAWQRSIRILELCCGIGMESAFTVFRHCYPLVRYTVAGGVEKDRERTRGNAPNVRHVE